MRLDKKGIDKNNKKAQNAYLKGEIETTQSRISLLGKDESTLLKEIKALKKQKGDALKEYEELSKNNVDIRSNIKTQTDEYQLQKEDFKKKLTVIEKESKDKYRLLGKLNIDVLSAKDELDILNEDLALLNNKIANKKPLLQEIKDLEKVKEQHRRELSSFLAEIAQTKAIYKEEYNRKEKELIAKTELLRETNYQIEQRTYEKNNLETSIVKRRKDVDVVVQRIEKVYKKTFPELRLNI